MKKFTTTILKITKSQIMKRAWEIARRLKKEFGGNVKNHFTLSLKSVYESINTFRVVFKDNFKQIYKIEAFDLEDLLKKVNNLSKNTQDIDRLLSIKGSYAEKERVKAEILTLLEKISESSKKFNEKRKVFKNTFGFTTGLQDIDTFHLQNKLACLLMMLKINKYKAHNLAHCDNGLIIEKFL